MFRYSFTEVAATGSRFVRFYPYVASIDEQGRVAFQAELQSGESRIFIDGEEQAPCDSQEYALSHPAISTSGVCYYATIRTQPFLICNGEKVLKANVGPLGPSINSAKEVAYRGEGLGGHGVFVVCGGREVVVADEKSSFTEFAGIPDINDLGEVVFRARRAHTQGIFCYRNSKVEAVAEIGADTISLGSFPCIDELGQVGYVATNSEGQAGLFCVSKGETRQLLSTENGFDSFRGVLLSGELTVFYGTPANTPLGIYSLYLGEVDKLLSIGDSYNGAIISAFALNPVSINPSGQLAIRIELSDKREVILRADPSLRIRKSHLQILDAGIFDEIAQ